jgi:hypothetical protein
MPLDLMPFVAVPQYSEFPDELSFLAHDNGQSQATARR